MITNKLRHDIPRHERGAALRARGMRLTTPRRVILDVVRATYAHPSAAIVHRLVRRRLPRVSLATVYRNLRTLAAKGFLLERAGCVGLRFDGNTAPHDHFTCVACGRIFDVPRLRRRVAPSRAGFEILEQRTELYGRCARCRARGGPSTTRRRRHGRREP